MINFHKKFGWIAKGGGVVHGPNPCTHCRPHPMAKTLPYQDPPQDPPKTLPNEDPLGRPLAPPLPPQPYPPRKTIPSLQAPLRPPSCPL
jgi:hypothetical protein